MSWRHLEDFFARRLEGVFKMFWRHMAKTNILVLIKTYSEDVWLERIYSSLSRSLKTSWGPLLKTKEKDFIKSKGLLGSIEIKTGINPRNSCFKVLKIARNKGRLSNAFNFAFISKFQIPYPNLKSLHLRARFINVTNIANIQKQSSGGDM